MDTNRLSIVNQDLSTSVNTTQEATLKGFTVIKAEKGPTKPVLISAGSSAEIYEIFGVTSASYSQVQEVLDFNQNFDIYVSAPYSAGISNEGSFTFESKIPAAYITPAGVFVSENPVGLHGVLLEDVKEGDLVEGLNYFTSDPSILIPMGIEDSIFATSDNVLANSNNVLSWVNDTLTFNFGFDLAEAMNSADGIDFLDASAFDKANDPSRILRKVGTAPEIVLDIPGEELLSIKVIVDGSAYSLETAEGEKICDIAAPTNSITITKEELEALTITSSAAARKYLTALAMSNIWGSSDFLNSVKVYWKASLDKDSVKAALIPKYVSENSISISLPKQPVGNKITFQATESTAAGYITSVNKTGSLLENDIDGFGASLSFEDVLDSQNVVDIITIDSFDTTDVYTATSNNSIPTLDAYSFRLSRGVRVVTDASVETAWEVQASDPDYEHVEIFMYPEVLNVVDDADKAFFSLANTHKLSRFVANLEVTDISDNMTVLSFGHNYFITTNEFLRKSSYTKENYWSPLIGHTASMYVKCVAEKMGGVAPMYLLNSKGLGGQLSVSTKKAKYRYKKDQLTYLDQANYNPIIKDKAFDVMIVGQKTANGSILSDWSYIGHTSAFLKLLREVRDEVMIPQLGKPNNDFYRDLRATHIDMILKPRIQGNSKIWAEAICDTSSAVNTADVLKERKFVIVIKVKVDIFSEGVDLTLINYAQDTDIV